MWAQFFNQQELYSMKAFQEASFNNDFYIEKDDREGEYLEGTFFYFAEMFSEFLAPIFNLENAKYFYMKDNSKYTLVSKSFIKSDNDYFLLHDLFKLTCVYKRMYDGSLNVLESFKQFYKTDLEYNKLVEAILNLFAFDFYTHQWDRQDFNIMFMNKKKSGLTDFVLAPIYDNELSFVQPYGSSEHIKNCFYCGNLNQDNFQALLEKYPSGIKAFKSILDINIEEQLRLFLIASEHNKHHITNTKKDTIKRIDEESKQLVLKHIK